jgi:general secretion pathway protein F
MAPFFHELAILLGSGIALDRALALIVQRTRQRGAGKASANLLSKIRGGSSLAQALAADGQFPKISIGLVRAGEASGTLDTELFRLSEMMARAAAIRSEIISALVYPVILLLTAGLSIGVIITVVVPEFVPLFDGSGHLPPFAFRFLMGLSQAITHWGWLAVTISGAGIITTQRLLKRPAIRKRSDRMKLLIPIFGGLAREIDTGRFCRTLGTLVKANVALPVAVALAVDSVANTAMAAALANVVKTLREGGRLADRLVATGQFAPDVTSLLRLGEESGRLGEMLLRQADISEVNMRTQISRMLAMLVPAITLVLGFIVAGIVTSLMVAILSVYDLAS